VCVCARVCVCVCSKSKHGVCVRAIVHGEPRPMFVIKVRVYVCVCAHARVSVCVPASELLASYEAVLSATGRSSSRTHLPRHTHGRC